MGTRACPHCGERIQNAAVMCRFCKQPVQKVEVISPIVKYGGGFVLFCVAVAFIAVAAGGGGVASSPPAIAPPAAAPDSAEVECSGGDEAISCSVKNMNDSHRLKVCFDMIIECAGDVRAVGHACQVVAPVATARRNIRYEDFKNGSKCKRIEGSSIENITTERQ